MIDEAVVSGARKDKACEEIGMSIRTLQRWQENGYISADKRPTANRPEPKNKLTAEEQQAILATSNIEEYANLGPSQIVPMLADDGQYLASESSFYRVLKANNQLTYRGKAQPKGSRAKPKGYTATAPNQVWTWDISYCVPGIRHLHGLHKRITNLSEIYTFETGVESV